MTMTICPGYLVRNCGHYRSHTVVGQTKTETSSPGKDSSGFHAVNKDLVSILKATMIC